MAILQREDSAKELINSLAVILKTAQIHNIDNISVTKAIDKFLLVLNPMVSKEPLVLELVGEFFHIDGTRVRYAMEYVFNYDFLVREFKKREVGTIAFEDTLEINAVKGIINAFLSAGFSQKPFDTLNELFKDIPYVSLKKLKDVAEDEHELDRKKIIKKTYFNTVALTQEISRKISAGKKVSLKKAKRIMETIVDKIIEEESTLIGMTTIKDYDEYTYNHSVNVSILAIALGHRLGLSKKTLADLGLSAILHDLGKIEVPKDILNKPDEFTDDDWQVVTKHPTWGACAVFKIRGVDTTSMSAFISAFEHHLHCDLSGYPKIQQKVTLDFFSRIIAIADQYDAMTSARVYSRVPISPDRTLSIMLDRSGSQLDPYLIKVFINMVGIYPLGSLVMLDTKELGLVFESNTNPVFADRPRIIVVVDEKGRKTRNTIDLMEKDDEGNFRRSIIKTLDPYHYKINLAEFLL
jgi:HD-GYP domain-containing protein (c-di-GMP phosphodiesterase class II)